MFNLSDIVVYPGYGVAKVTREVNKILGGESIKLYELQFMNKDVTILVPIEGMLAVGIRKPGTAQDVLDIFSIFCIPLTADDITELNMSSWNRRSKDYQNKIRAGKLKELAMIYRDLKTIELGKQLSFGEKAVMAQVETLIAEECSVVEVRPIGDIVKEIQVCCDACIKGLSHTLSRFLSFTLPPVQHDSVLVRK